MRGTLTVLATAAVIGAMAVSSPASAAAAKGPKLGSWTCSDAAAAPVAALELSKGNRYAVDGGDKAKYVYKAGKQRLKFKSGAYEDVYYGMFDKETKTIALHTMADDSVWASCTRAEVVEEPAPTP